MSQNKIDVNLARETLWRRGHLSWLLDSNQQDLYKLFHENPAKIQTWLLARRCLAEGTLIKTPTGLVAIERLKVGDEVFGYNEDGSISVCKVKETFNNGPKEVWDLTSGGRVLETCTKDHIWLTANEYDGRLIEREVKNIKKYNKIVRKWVDHSELSGINEPHAYAIGALLGDGCSRQGVNKIHISSENEIIPNKIAKIIEAPYIYRSAETNYTWIISNEEKQIRGASPINNKQVNCNYYDEWCKGRYAHEKIANLDIIKTWDVESQLSFLAGIIDTDGSFHTSENCLIYSIEMQSYSVIEACQYIIHNLFQYKPVIRIYDRDKFINGPTYAISIKNNLICKKMLRALSKYQVVERKKWKPDHEMYLENNSNANYVGIKTNNPRIMNTYDIHIDNATNLYLTSNGLVTHNSGKSFSLCVLAIEYCLKNPRSVVKYVAPTKRQVERFIQPIIDFDILSKGGCPEDLKPKYNKKEEIYHFPNGSQLQLCGAESGNIDSIRGGFAHIAIIDEAQDVSQLKYAVNSVLLPTTLTTKGKILISGTPPQDPDHEFIHFIEEASATNTLIKRTIYDNPRLTQEDIKLQVEALRGETSEEFRREYLCEIIKSSSRSVLPEVTDDLLKEIVKEWESPPFYSAYTSMDVGLRDWTVVLFGYYDFRSDKIIIQDEIATYGPEMHLPDLTNKIKKKEEDLWTNPITNEFMKPYKRVSDHDPIVVNEIKKHSNYTIFFENADKKEKMAGINWLRTLLAAKKIIINPRCTNLIRHLKDGKWKNTSDKDTFAKCPLGSHYDGIDALVYFVKAVDFTKNPYPRDYQTPLRSGDAFYNNNYNRNQAENSDIYKKIMNIKKKDSSNSSSDWLKYLNKDKGNK